MSDCQPRVYKRRLPEKTALYKVFQQHFESWLSEYPLNHQESVPHYVENEIRSYLKCGILAYGFARARCSDCSHEYIVGFSCKSRGICNSCCAKYMTMSAAHIMDQVLPKVATRQFVLALPKRIRYYVARDSLLSSKVLKIFIQEIEKHFKMSLPAISSNAKLGAITFNQRFGSYLNLHCHYHTIVIEGLFHQDDSAHIKFTPVDHLGPEDIEIIEQKVRNRVLKLFKRSKILSPDQVDSMLGWKNSGFSLNADVGIGAEDRNGLERLLRYCARPAFASDQLTLQANDKILYRYAKPTPQGQTEQLFTPNDFIDKLVQLIPLPRRHRHHYHGVLAPNSPYRKHIVEFAGKPLPESMGELKPKSKAGKKKDKVKVKMRYLWCILLSRVYELMPLQCPAHRIYVGFAQGAAP